MGKAIVTYPVELAWAAVAGADRINNGEYINQNYFPRAAESRYNKEIAYDLLSNTDKITEEDRQLGTKLSEHFSGLLFKLIGKTPPPFMQAVATIVAKNDVTRYDVAVMSSLPRAYRYDIEREGKRDRKFSLIRTSNHVGQPGESKEMDIEVFDFFYSKNYNVNVYTATDGENLIRFSSPKGTDIFPLNTKIRVKGKVKRIDLDQNGAKETWLNRVKRV
jgi:hypothetical protein